MGLLNTFRREYDLVILIVLSAPLLFFLGLITDLVLVYFYSHFEKSADSLPAISAFVHTAIAGYRYLTLEFNLCIWLFFVLSFFGVFLLNKNSVDIRKNVVFSMLLGWLTALSIMTFLVFASLLPFEHMLDRLDNGSLLETLLHVAIGVEIVVIVLLVLVVGLLRIEKSKEGIDLTIRN